MRKKLTEPFGKAGLTVAILALVMALVGGAYAAGGLTKSQEKQVTKIAKKYAGKPGAAGPAGAAGTAGTNGTNGKDGAAGTSVTSEEFAGTKEGHCVGLGGSKFTSASGKTFACNGEPGETGFTETLPSEKTETGIWGFTSHAAGIYIEPISFPIPLAAALAPANLHFVTEAEVTGHTAPAECPGSVSTPTAVKGNLCVYATPPLEGASFFGFQAEPLASGANAEFLIPEAKGGFGEGFTKGSWAVTAP